MVLLLTSIFLLALGRIFAKIIVAFYMASDPEIVCVYVDNSNIFHEGQRYAEQTKHENRHAFRIHFRNFLTLIAGDRPLAEVVWSGSIPPPDDSVWTHLKSLHIKPDLIPRASTGEHETVDHLIQLRMHRYARKYRNNSGVIALCTGDGKGYAKEEGFLFDLEGFAEDGWKVEVFSWTHACHGKLKRFAETAGEFVPLERWYHNISFIQGGRHVEPLSPDFPNELPS